MPDVKVEEKKPEATPPVVEEKAPTPEEIEARHKQVIEAMFRDPEPAKKKPAEEPPKVEEKKLEEKPVEPPKVEPPKVEEKKPEEKPKRALPPEPELAKPPERKAPEAAPAIRYTPAEQRTLAAADHLAASFPDHYEHLRQRTEDFWKNRKIYKTKWEGENPGKPFNEEDEEHNEFYDRNDPNVDEEDLKWARDEVLKTETRKEAKAEAIEATEVRALKDAEPRILAAAADGVRQLIEGSIPEDLLKTIAPTGVQLNKEFSDKLLEENPAVHSFVMEEGEALNLMLIEWKKLTEHGAAYEVNTSKKVKLRNSIRSFAPQEEVLSFFVDLENQIAGQPAEETMDDGRRFLKADKYNRHLQAEIDASESPEDAHRRIEEFKSKYWKLLPGHITDALIKRSTENVKSRIDRVETTYKKRAEKSKTSAKVEDPPKAEEKKDPPKGGKSPEAITTSESRDNVKSPTGELSQTDRIITQMFR